VIDPNQEPLSQTVGTPSQQAFMRKLADERTLRALVSVDGGHRLGGGTSEIQKNVIARRGLGLSPAY